MPYKVSSDHAGIEARRIIVIILCFSLDRCLSFLCARVPLAVRLFFIFNFLELASHLQLLPLALSTFPGGNFPMSNFSPSLAGDDSSPENVESIALLYRISLVLLSITGLFVAAKLPQVIALFGTTSEWFDGLFLHYIPYSPSRNRSYPQMSTKTDLTSNISHTLHSHYTLPMKRVAEKGSPVTMRYPPHAGSCIKFLYPFLTMLRIRTSPGFSIAQSLIFSIYLACLGYATFYRSNIFTDQTRTAWVAVTQLPFLFLLAQKSSILGFLLGCGYEKVSYSLPTSQKNKS